MRENQTQISSKGWSLEKVESFVKDMKTRFSHTSPVRARRIRAAGRYQFVETSIEIFPTEDIESFVYQMERDFGFTDVEYTYEDNDISSVSMTIKIKIDDNGKEINRHK